MVSQMKTTFLLVGLAVLPLLAGCNRAESAPESGTETAQAVAPAKPASTAAAPKAWSAPATTAHGASTDGFGGDTPRVGPTLTGNTHAAPVAPELAIAESIAVKGAGVELPTTEEVAALKRDYQNHLQMIEEEARVAAYEAGVAAAKAWLFSIVRNEYLRAVGSARQPIDQRLAFPGRRVVQKRHGFVKGRNRADQIQIDSPNLQRPFRQRLRL